MPLVADDNLTITNVTISEQIDAVMNEAARLGVPVLAVASTDSCSEGPVLKRQLAGNPAVQPLVSRFAIVELRMSGDNKWEWHRWQDRFDTHRRNTPQVFVIRADGRMIFSGDPPADQFEAQLAAASRLQAEGDLVGAVGAVMPAVRMPSFARPIVQSVAFRATVAEGLLQRIEKDDGKMDAENPDGENADAEKPVSATDRLAAVEEIVAASEQFVATLPEVVRAATKRLAEISRDPDGRETVRQAQLLHRAAVAARRSPDRGLALYQQIIAMHPDSPAAKLAATRMSELDGVSP